MSNIWLINTLKNKKQQIAIRLHRRSILRLASSERRYDLKKSIYKDIDNHWTGEEYLRTLFNLPTYMNDILVKAHNNLDKKIKELENEN